jgi:hypothetical protein
MRVPLSPSMHSTNRKPVMRSPRIFALVAVTLLLGNLSLAREEEKNVENFGKTSQGIGDLDRAAIFMLRATDAGKSGQP